MGVDVSRPASGSVPEPTLQQFFHRNDLFSLSVSSVGPLFSVAATGGVMVAQAGWWTLPALAVIAVPFLISGFIFRLLNEHFPHAGASYHWSARIIGRRASRFQAWVLILAYFASIPPIIIPAATYTIALVAPYSHPSPLTQVLVGTGWACFALIPLLGGGRPTATFTKAFLTVELLALVALVFLGVSRYSAIKVPVHFGPLPVGGIFIVGVIAATVLDGWEIDSYASEEAQRPRTDPGVAGIVGAFGALLFYVILYPLMLAEVPLHELAGATNPLAVWGERLVPGAPWIILLPVLASTAGGMWLTSFILTRALYAMGREGVVPQAFGKLNRRRVPHVAILTTLGAATVVVALQVLVTSLTAFFALVLSAAGFFLVVEFFLDSTTAVVFLTRGHLKLIDQDGGGGRTKMAHRHRALTVASVLCSLMFFSFGVGFFVFGPAAIGGAVDYVLAGLLLLGVVFALRTGSMKGKRIFEGRDLTPEEIARHRGRAPAIGS